MLINQYRVELVREKGVRYGEDVSTQNSGDVAELLNKVYSASSLAEEHAWLVCLNTKGRVNGLFEIGRGSMNAAMMDVKVIVRNALLCNAAAVIVAHNHPSGDPTPSDEDVRITGHLKSALSIVELQLLDHIVLGSGSSYCSCADMGLLTARE